MKLTRKYRILTALVALFGVLFMQLAVAAYARYGFDASWYVAVGLAVIVYLLPPFILSRVWAKMHGDDLP